MLKVIGISLDSEEYLVRIVGEQLLNIVLV